MAMTEQRRRYAQFKLKGLNNTKAALQAGYSEKTAKAQGYQLSVNPEVLAYMEELKSLNEEHPKSPAVEEDVSIALLCKDPIEKLIELMNCGDEFIEKDCAKALLPYFYMKKVEQGQAKLGKRELKEVKAIEATNTSRFSTLSNQLGHTVEHIEEE